MPILLVLINARSQTAESSARFSISGTVTTNSGPVIQGDIKAGTMNFGSKRRAPSPPKLLQSARALYDFIPEPEDGQALRFKKGDIIELEDRNAIDENGWVKGRIKGGNGEWRIVPLKYVE